MNGVNFNSLIGVAAAVTGGAGATGATGATGPVGIAGILGAAEFTRIIAQPAPGSTPPGTAFTIDTQVYNNVPLVIVASAGAGGTVFNLNTTGTYIVDYEMSLDQPSAVGIYKGANAGSLTLDPNTVAGSSAATPTWIHGRALITVGATPVVFAISTVVGTYTVVTAGTAPQIMIRLTILKISTT